MVSTWWYWLRFWKYIIKILFHPTIQVAHAEANAIMHKTCIDLKECSLYTTFFPCNECTKLIIQSGIKKVYFLEGEPQSPASAKHGETEAKKDKMYIIASHRLFQMAGYMMVFDTSLELPPDTAKWAYSQWFKYCNIQIC